MLTFTKEEQAKEDKWAQDKMYHAARYAWKKRFDPLPFGRGTWAEWFKKMFNRDLFEYAKEMSAKKKEESHGEI